MCLPKQAYHLICIIKEAKRKQAETVVDLATIIFYHRNVSIDWKKKHTIYIFQKISTWLANSFFTG